MGRKGIDLTGKRFGKLTVVRPIDRIGLRHKWLCKCDCGNETIVFGNNLGTNTFSCGCYARECSSKRNGTHRQSKTRLFHIWQDMVQRCTNPNNHAYQRYGGRGIKVCDEWLNSFETFAEWAHANGFREDAKRGECTLDRADNNGNYEPSNCRWITNAEQQDNKRNAVLLSFNGCTMSVARWAEKTGLTHSTILGRIRRGWSVERTLTTPPMRVRVCK